MDTQLAVDLWLEALEVEGRSPATLTTYRASIKPLIMAMPALDPGAQFALRRHLNEYRVGHAAASVRALFVTWRTFLNWCVREELLEASPLRGTRAPKLEETTKDVYTKSQIIALFAYLAGVRTPIGFRNQAVCAVLLDAGLRASELCRLKVEDVADGAIIVRRSKSGRPRVIPLGTRSHQLLGRYLAYGRPKLRPASDVLFVNQFGRGIDRHGLTHLLGRVGDGVGFHVSAHKFRHTAATAWVRGGLSMETVRRLGGWAGYEVIRASYLHLDDSDLREAQLRASPLDRMR